METLVVTHKNGIALAETVAFNPLNIVKYANNSASKAVVRYDVGVGGNDKPVDYTLSISKTDLDALIPAMDLIVVLNVNVLDPKTGLSTATSFNQKYITSIKETKAFIGSAIDSSLVEIVYANGSFTPERVFADGTISSLTYILPTHYIAPVDPVSLKYSAFHTQVGTAAPVATILEDAIEGVWARASAGTFTYTKVGAFTANKTKPGKIEGYYDVAGNYMTIEPTSVDVITLKTYAAADTEALADGVLSDQEINIEIYL